MQEKTTKTQCNRLMNKISKISSMLTTFDGLLGKLSFLALRGKEPVDRRRLSSGL